MPTGWYAVNVVEAQAAANEVAAQVAARVAAQIKSKAVKSISGMADDYYVQLSEAVTGFFNRDTSAAEVSSVMRQLIKSYAWDTYYEGMKEGGIDNPEDEISDDEQAQVSEWITEQLGYVADFIQALKDTRRAEDVTAAQEAINARVELWRGSMENLGSLGKAAALKNKMVEWVYGDTVHCATCAKLNGQKHRVKWFIDNGYIPQENGSETLECGGGHCQCTLVDMEGEQVMP
jgi:hypothetical protein